MTKLGTKLAAVVTQYLVATITVIISFVLLIILFPNEIGITIIFKSIPWEIILSIYLTTITFGIFLVVLIFFSQIISRLVTRFQGLITGVTIIVLFWLTNKLFFPIIWHSNYSPGFDYIPVQPFLYTSLSYMLTALVLFIAAALIYDRRVEL